MSRIRAGFLVGSMSAGWLGGLNYFRNLFSALDEWPERSVDPVMVLGRKAGGDHYKEFKNFEVTRAACLDRAHPAWILRHSIYRVFGRDLVLGAALKKSRIEFQSHSPAVARSSVPIASWIADFQHVHFPNFFTPGDLRFRESSFRDSIRFSDAIILSSADAQKDLAAYDAHGARKSRVLHFVASPPSVENVPSGESLAGKYGIEGPYFHLPNQFWAHKNHEVAVKALGILKRAGRAVTVIATGNTRDDRQPGFFESLMQTARAEGVEEQFRVIGMVPYADLVGLMVNSTALINPSLFEGWSTTVEEAKSLGKRVLLSNLAVHREQNPPGGVYFDPRDPADLAGRMAEVSEDRGFDAAGLAARAAREFPERRREFARAYCRIVEEIARPGTRLNSEATAG